MRRELTLIIALGTVIALSAAAVALAGETPNQVIDGNL